MLNMVTPNTSTKVENFRPPSAEDLTVDPDSALRSVANMSRSSVADERDMQDVSKHTHDGTNSERVELKSLRGFIRSTSVIPTWMPTDVEEQIVIYVNGGTKKLYVYHMVAKTWLSVTIA